MFGFVEKKEEKSSNVPAARSKKDKCSRHFGTLNYCLFIYFFTSLLLLFFYKKASLYREVWRVFREF